MRFLSLLFAAACLVAAPASAQTPAAAPAPVGPQSGQKVAFLGDSITQFAWGNPGGYIHLVDIAMKQAGRPIVVIPAGISGNTSKDMIARLSRDVLSKKPDWMTLSCGVNDVWHGANGVPLDQYKANITSIVDQCTAAGIKVIILTSTMIGEDQSLANNQKLLAYNDFLRSLAKQRGLPLADLNADEQAELARMRAGAHPPGPLLTLDGVHMNNLGHEMMATGILKAFGLTDAQLAQVRDTWLDLPNGMPLSPRTGITARQFEQLQALAAAQNKTVDALVSDTFAKSLHDLLATAPAAH